MVSDGMKQKTVAVALVELEHMPQKAARMLRKLIASAAANAREESASLTDEQLAIENITVDKGITYTRYMPRAFGRATPINRECSHVRVTLRALAPVVAEKPAAKKEEKEAPKANDKKDEVKETADAK